MASAHRVPSRVHPPYPRASNRDALDALVTSAYEDLRAVARRLLRLERSRCELVPAALVHECYIRMAGQRTDWKNEQQVVAIAVKMMRRVLVDRARMQRTWKRAGGVVPAAPLRGKIGTPSADLANEELIALAQALARMRSRHALRARTVALRAYRGLTVGEIASCLAVSPSTVKRSLAEARPVLRALILPPRGDGR